jgi:hypothetical protein
MLKDGRRAGRPARGTSFRFQNLIVCRAGWTPPCGILDSTFFGPRFPWRAFFCPQQGSNWNRLPLFEFESATGHADFSALRFFNLDDSPAAPRFLSGGPPQRARVQRRKLSKQLYRRASGLLLVADLRSRLECQIRLAIARFYLENRSVRRPHGGKRLP